MQGALSEAGRRKDVFLAILAHEGRNPLVPIRNDARDLESLPPQIQWKQGHR
ncbi:protein of unknown function (plasmid) [Caballeronia sp. S22]